MLLAWQLRYLGWQRLPKELSRFDIERFFTLALAEVDAVRSQYKESLRLGEFSKISALQELRVDQYPTDALTSEHQHAYARRITQRRPTRFRGLREPRRTIELVSFFRHALAEHTDIGVEMIDRRVAQLWRRARDEARLDGSSTAAHTFIERVRAIVAGEITADTAGARLAEVKELLGSWTMAR
jgi:hypothetical protein